MSRLRAYIKPRNTNGDFLPEFIEVTEDVDFDATGNISQLIDNNEFNVGQFKFSDFDLKLRNQLGAYSDVDVLQSIFRTRRAGSQFKLTWSPSDQSPQCGDSIAGNSYGATIDSPVDVFIGVINDEASKLDIDDQQITFSVLSTDSIFTTIEAPFNLLSIGQLYSDAIFAILNQVSVTEYLLLDVGNITLGLDQTFDVVTQYENKTVKEVLDDVLRQANAIIFIKEETIFIRPRDGGLVSKYTFIGQGSNDGIEDIIKISDVTTGLNKVFNYWTFADTDLIAKDVGSIDINLIRKKEISVEAITNTAKRQAILNSQRDTFKNKKQRFDLTVAINSDLLGLFLLDRVTVDYPTIFIPGETGGELPIYGIAIYNESFYGFGEFALTIDKITPYKIMGRTIETVKQTIKFKLEEI